MAPRANWKGYLRLSLVTCPVALFPATSESEKVSFNQINKRTGHRIKYQRVDAETGEDVDNEDIVKGYKVDTDTYIEVTKDELDNIALESNRTIDIDQFVPRDEIDDLYVVRPYYLVPDGKVGHDAYAVIRDTIKATDKVALARVVLTNREHVIALEARDKGLVGLLLRYPYEVRQSGRILRRHPGREDHQGHARSCKAYRRSEVRALRSGQIRGQLRDRADRPDQPEARRPSDRQGQGEDRGQRHQPDGRACARA